MRYKRAFEHVVELHPRKEGPCSDGNSGITILVKNTCGRVAPEETPFCRERKWSGGTRNAIESSRGWTETGKLQLNACGQAETGESFFSLLAYTYINVSVYVCVYVRLFVYLSSCLSVYMWLYGCLNVIQLKKACSVKTH